MATTILSYARVSTEEQAREGVSLAAQREKVRLWAALHYPEAQIVEFADEGLSGARLRGRKALAAAIDVAATAPSPILVVYSLSRLSRSTKDTLFLAEKLDKIGCELVSLSEKLDTTSAAGKMVFRLLAVLAEFERDQISERTSTAMGHLRKKGKRFSRFPPYPDVVTARAAALREQGESYANIAKWLTIEGFQTHLGGPWQPAVVRRLAKRKPSK